MFQSHLGPMMKLAKTEAFLVFLMLVHPSPMWKTREDLKDLCRTVGEVPLFIWVDLTREAPCVIMASLAIHEAIRTRLNEQGELVSNPYKTLLNTW